MSKEEAMKLAQMLDALIQKYSDKLYDRTGATAATDFELDVAAIRLTLADQLTQVEVCCGDYGKCMKPCTPRGKWLAEQPAPVQEPTRVWVGLTRKEVHDLYDSDHEVFHRRIESKLKEKNT